MKKLLSLIFLAFLSFNVTAQEICDNGIDDDADGLIDLNDDECECDGLGIEVESLIPNPSFEEMDCCPDAHSMLECATTWIQASDATSDYYNTCDFTVIVGEGHTAADITDIPDGEGWVGYWSSAFYSEYIGACLDAPLLAGVEYTLNFHTAWGMGPEEHEFTIFATPNCSDLPWSGSSCPIGDGDWELMETVVITYPTDGTWQEATITFTPTVDMNAIAFGGDCTGPDEMRYTYIDDLTLIDSDSYSEITEVGSWCEGDLSLDVSIDTVGGTWQWYLDGVALVGETSTTLDVMLYGLGDYSAVYFIGDNCKRIDKTIIDEEGVSANFTASNACLGDPITFTNTSEVGAGLDPDWEWDFGDLGSSTEESPSYTYAEAGTYTVELIGVVETGCNDTIEVEVTVDPNPIADFEFIIGGLSSEDGLTGGCIESTVEFNDLSIIADPGVITSWSWNFGDGDTSDEENPEHDYDAAGTYTITLTVETENGCSGTAELDIIMSNALALDLIYNEPTCFGLSDGSVTVNVTGGSGDMTFTITDSDGNILNLENSNTANNLPTGWYYANVEDGTSCSGLDSVFIDQPGELDAEVEIIHVRCNGDATGIAEVVNVINAQGDPENIAYFWEPNMFGDEGIGVDSAYSMPAGEYVLTINDDNGCSKTIDFIINEPPPMEFVEIGFEPAFCRVFSYQNGNGVVYAGAAGGTPDYNYTWTDLQNGDTEDGTTWGGRNPGDYEIRAIDENGCVLIDTVTVDSLNPIADFEVISAQLNSDCQGTGPIDVEFINKSLFFADPKDPNADTTFFWNFDTLNTNWILSEDFFETFDLTYDGQSNTYYIDVCLVAINKNGCTDTACKVITVYPEIKFTDVNIFTPNGDGKNDVFTFEFRAQSISEFHCVIVDRWGIVMAELNDVSDSWDGTTQGGKKCKDGVYFYKYEATTDNASKLNGQGTIELIGSSD